MGDKGQGDTTESSDGVVPCWSSHVTPVASELIVSSNHSVPNNIEASDEIRRILLLHLKAEGKLKPGSNASPRLNSAPR
ncbi:MAG: hypothetical protein OSA84_01030 [Akkermansiaceae bacterium]|nr:hypothetical protein [Akkermansiaceae bacterium]